MPGINLAQSASHSSERKSVTWFGKGALFMIVLLAMVIFSWVGLALYEGKLVSEIEAATALIAERRDELSLSGTGADLVVEAADFQHRIDEIGRILLSRNDPGSILRSLENVMLPGIVVTSFNFDRGDASSRMVQIEGVSDNIGLIAQELVLFKRGASVASVSVGDIVRQQDGKMKFSLSVSLLDLKQ